MAGQHTEDHAKRGAKSQKLTTCVTHTKQDAQM